MASMLDGGMTGAGATSTCVRPGPRTHAWQTAVRAAVIGVGSVAGGFAVSLIAAAWLGGSDDAYSPADWLSDSGLLLALPCAVIA